MEQFIIPGGLLFFMLGSLVAVRVGLAKRPTFDEANEKYKEQKVCDEIHKSIDEKIKCIPEIKETVIEIRTILKERSRDG